MSNKLNYFLSQYITQITIEICLIYGRLYPAQLFKTMEAVINLQKIGFILPTLTILWSN